MAGYNGYIGGVKHIDGVPNVTSETAHAAIELVEVYKYKIANARYEAGRSLTRIEAEERISQYNGYIQDLQHKARIA